jgi:hypothetical protein
MLYSIYQVTKCLIGGRFPFIESWLSVRKGLHYFQERYNEFVPAMMLRRQACKIYVEGIKIDGKKSCLHRGYLL